jgi:hypothetical protein
MNCTDQHVYSKVLVFSTSQCLMSTRERVSFTDKIETTIPTFGARDHLQCSSDVMRPSWRTLKDCVGAVKLSLCCSRDNSMIHRAHSKCLSWGPGKIVISHLSDPSRTALSLIRSRLVTLCMCSSAHAYAWTLQYKRHQLTLRDTLHINTLDLVLCTPFHLTLA